MTPTQSTPDVTFDGTFDTDHLLYDAVERWATERPDEAAVSYGDATYTWTQWRERLRRVMGGLLALGLRPGDRIATVDLNSLACVELTHAASAVGVAHVVVNFRLIGDQLAYVLGDSNPSVLFVGPELQESVAGVDAELPEPPSHTGRRTILVGGDADEYEAWVAASEPADPIAEAVADDVALVLYSSGTTGFPKGVELTNRNLNAHSDAAGGAFAFNPGDTSLACMPLFHVGGTCFAVASLHHGEHTIIMRALEPAALLGLIAQGVNHVFLVPAVIGGLLAAGEPAVSIMGKLDGLVYGASPMPVPMIAKAVAAWPNTRIMQVYGMTELAGVTTMLPDAAHRDPAHPERLASAGLPLAGVEMRVVDPISLEDVPVGEVGEVWFRTAQSMRGYLGRPAATAETVDADGWLRTGDLGRVDDGGFVFVMDRLKDMIITGGENVYSPEVESVVAAHPGVVDVAVIGVPDDTWGESVKAFVVAAPGTTIDPDEVIAFTRERLAHYKCPRSVEVVAELPRNPTGKILKRTLRQPYWDGHDRAVH